MTRAQPEYRLHCVVADYLRVAIVPGSCIWRSSLDGARLNRATAGRMKRIGAIVEGWPDLAFILAAGRTLFIELKPPGEYPSAEQRAVHERLRALGAAVYVARTLDEVIAALQNEDVPLRDARIGRAA